MTKQSFKQLSKLPPHIQRRIILKLDFFTKQEDLLFFAEQLIHHSIGSYRFRIETYRIVFDIEDTNIIILAIGHRRNIYH